MKGARPNRLSINELSNKVVFSTVRNFLFRCKACNLYWA